MGADNHPTVVPSNFEKNEETPSREVKTVNDGDHPIYHVWVSDSIGGTLKPSFIYISASSPDIAWLRAQYVGATFGAIHPSQVELHPVELYV